MDYYEAKELQKKDLVTECSHDKIEKEIYEGEHTGDYVCTICGKSFSIYDFLMRK